ncbi:uncharacterized protein LOC131438916 [Malaya genurostris]|uniref:uncharacterized protein LOC131438916 n=1 Tax=Malaya genurostris TaxID=325434 RepID=UPI0026F3A4B4|nr:uncharacterized protein LOC131438916 [Malaya genurostris]
MATGSENNLSVLADQLKRIEFVNVNHSLESDSKLKSCVSAMTSEFYSTIKRNYLQWKEFVKETNQIINANELNHRDSTPAACVEDSSSEDEVDLQLMWDVSLVSNADSCNEDSFRRSICQQDVKRERVFDYLCTLDDSKWSTVDVDSPVEPESPVVYDSTIDRTESAEIKLVVSELIVPESQESIVTLNPDRMANDTAVEIQIGKIVLSGDDNESTTLVGGHTFDSITLAENGEIPLTQYVEKLEKLNGRNIENTDKQATSLGTDEVLCSCIDSGNLTMENKLNLPQEIEDIRETAPQQIQSISTDCEEQLSHLASAATGTVSEKVDIDTKPLREPVTEASEEHIKLDVERNVRNYDENGIFQNDSVVPEIYEPDVIPSSFSQDNCMQLAQVDREHCMLESTEFRLIPNFLTINMGIEIAEKLSTEAEIAEVIEPAGPESSLGMGRNLQSRNRLSLRNTNPTVVTSTLATNSKTAKSQMHPEEPCQEKTTSDETRKITLTKAQSEPLLNSIYYTCSNVSTLNESRSKPMELDESKKRTDESIKTSLNLALSRPSAERTLSDHGVNCETSLRNDSVTVSEVKSSQKKVHFNPTVEEVQNGNRSFRNTFSRSECNDELEPLNSIATYDSKDENRSDSMNLNDAFCTSSTNTKCAGKKTRPANSKAKRMPSKSRANSSSKDLSPKKALKNNKAFEKTQRTSESDESSLVPLNSTAGFKNVISNVTENNPETTVKKTRPVRSTAKKVPPKPRTNSSMGSPSPKKVLRNNRSFGKSKSTSKLAKFSDVPSKVTLNSIAACNNGDVYDISHVSDEESSTLSLGRRKPARGADVAEVTKPSVSDESSVQSQETLSDSLRHEVQMFMQQTIKSFHLEHKTGKPKRSRSDKYAELKTIIQETIKMELQAQFKNLQTRKRKYRPPAAKPRKVIIVQKAVPKRYPTTERSTQIDDPPTADKYTQIEGPATAEISTNTGNWKKRTAKKHTTEKKSKTNEPSCIRNKKQSVEARRNQPTLSQCFEHHPFPTGVGFVEQHRSNDEPLEVPETPRTSDHGNEPDRRTDWEQYDHEEDAREFRCSKQTKGCYRVPCSPNCSSIFSTSFWQNTESLSSYAPDVLENMDIEQANEFFQKLEQLHLSTMSESSPCQIVSNSQNKSSVSRTRRRSTGNRRTVLRPYPACPKIRAPSVVLQARKTLCTVEREGNNQDSLLEPILVGPFNDPVLYPEECLEFIGKRFVKDWRYWRLRHFPESYEKMGQFSTRHLHFNMIHGHYDKIDLLDENDGDESREDNQIDDDNDNAKYRAPWPFCSSVKKSQNLRPFSPEISPIVFEQNENDDSGPIVPY